MTIDNKHNFADAQVLLDSDYFPSTDEPVQAVLVSPDNESDVKAPGAFRVHATNVSPVNNPGTAPRGQDPDTVAHDIQHKRNVVTGVISGVAIVLILFGPIGAVAGGFIGSSIVNLREKGWHRCHHHQGLYRGPHGMVGNRGRCHRW